MDQHAPIQSDEMPEPRVQPHQVPQILTDARALIPTPERWLQGRMSGYRELGHELPGTGFDSRYYAHHRSNLPEKAEVVRCFCALGALTEASETPPSQLPPGCLTAPLAQAARERALEQGALRAAGIADDMTAVATYNDHAYTTHADVLAVYDRAIELAKAAVA